MNPFLLLRGEFKRSLGAALAVALVLALASSLGVTVSLEERAIRQGMAQAGDDFDLIIGAQGSSVQLVLGAVYLQPEALQLLPVETLGKVQEQSGVKWAAPLAFGDRWKSSPIIGTSADMVLLGGSRPLLEGSVFADEHDAVVGVSVPLELGSEFSPMHGIGPSLSDDAHGEHTHVHYTVTGRLPATGTPWDRAILVPVASLWHAHKGDVSGYSAIVVKPKSFGDAYKLRAAWTSAATQGVFTGEVLTSLFATMGNVRDIMQYMAMSAEAVALCAALLAGFFAVALRRKTLALLRALGAPRRYIICTVWIMVTCIIIVGALAGLGLGRLAAQVIANAIQDNTGVSIAVALSEHEWGLTAAIAAAGSLVALLPALAAFRTSAGDVLRG